MKRILQILALLCLTLPGTATAVADTAQKTVLITGANRGIGFEFVKQYADKGYRVIATCRNPDGATELNRFAKSHPGVIVETLDLIDLDGIDTLAKKYAGQPIDVLVSSAALMRGPDKEQTFGSLDFGDWFDRFFYTNVRGPTKVAEAFWPNLVASENGIAGFLTTGQGKHGIPVLGFAYYKSSKAAMDNMVLDIGRKGKRDGVRAVTISPGRVATHGEPQTRSMVPIEKSVAGMIAVFDSFPIEKNGSYFRWDGSEPTP